MRKSTSLCFSSHGLANPEAVSFLQGKDIDTVVLFGDGSEEAFDHMVNFDYDHLFTTTSVTKLAVGKTPLYELRVRHQDNSLSKPHYVLDEDLKARWLCANVCAPYITLAVSDITSQSETQVELDQSQTELMCYAAYQLWQIMVSIEKEICFPAAAINGLIQHTYSLKPNVIDIWQLRQKSGLSTLEYSPTTDLLSLIVADDIYHVKLSLLDELYGRYILPRFNEINGRKLRIRMTIKGTMGKFSDPMDTDYGELGRVVSDMMRVAQETKITADCPIEEADLLTFAKKAKINDESCIWLTTTSSPSLQVAAQHDIIVHDEPVNPINTIISERIFDQTLPA